MLLIDGGSGYRVRAVPPPTVPAPIQHTPSNTAGPRPATQIKEPSPRLLKNDGITRAEFLRQESEALRQQAAEAQRKAQEARQLAEQSRQQALVAEQKAKKSHSHEDQDTAKKLRTQADADEGNALKCEADATLKDKQAKLEACKLKDLQEGRGAGDPSRETRAAQLDVDTAAGTVSVLYGPPPGEPDPLTKAGDETQRLAKAGQWDQWQDAAKQEIRLAGLRAAGRGEDPQAAMQQQADAIEKRDVDGSVFTFKDSKGKEHQVTGHTWVNDLRTSVARQGLSENAVYAEHYQAQKLWQKVLKQVDEDAVTARHDASPAAIIPAGTPSGLRQEYAPEVAKAGQVADGKEEDAKWWSLRSQSATSTSEFSLGHDYDQRLADLGVQSTETDYQVALAGGDDKAIAAADTARKRALDDQTVLRDLGTWQASQIDLLDAQEQDAQAKAAYESASATQVAPQKVTYKGRYGTESTHTVYPDGCDPAFWAKPGSDLGKNVEYDAKDKKYYYVSSTGGRYPTTKREELPAATAGLWEAHDRLNGRKADDKQPGAPGAVQVAKDAKADYKTSDKLLGAQGPNGDEASLLDPSRWERRSDEIEGNLRQANDDVATAERSLSLAMQYGGANVNLDGSIADVGEQVQARDRAQAEVDALHAVERWRASPGDKGLRKEASDAIAKWNNFPGVSQPQIKALRSGRDDAVEQRTQLQNQADKGKGKPGDGQEILKLDLKIEHYDALIKQAEAGFQRSGALYLNKKFSFGDGELDAKGDTRLARQHDADGREGGIDAAPPTNYAELMAGAQPDEDGARKLPDGTRILKDGSWQVADRMVTIYKDVDGHVYSTGNRNAGGVRLSPENERLWLQLWDADKAATAADEGVTKTQQSVDTWNSLHPTDPIKVPGADGKPVETGQDSLVLGADGKPVSILSVDDDLTQRQKDLQQHVDASSGSSTIAPELLTLDRAELTAVNALIDVQQASRALLDWQAGQRAGAHQDAASGKDLERKLRDAETHAAGVRDKYLTLRNTQQVTLADGRRTTARHEHESWQTQHPDLVGTPAERRSDTWKNLEQAEAGYSQARQVQAGGVTPAAWTAQKDLIDSLAPEDRSNPAKLHELFMAHPEVMARPFINQHFLQYGSAPIQMEGRTHLESEVRRALELPSGPLNGAQKQTYEAVVDQIAGIGGDDARVTVLPVVYSTRETGVVKTVVFKVEDKQGGAQYVDDRGARYKDLDDFRANNSLPATDCNMVMPEDDKSTLDPQGNVKLSVTDARTETGFEEWRRENNVDMWIGGISVGLGVVMTVCSGGVLAPLAVGAAALLVGASGYGVVTSAMSLSNRSQHGLSVNPFTDREARMDWLNLGASAIAIPTLGAAGRATALAWQAGRAGKAAGVTFEELTQVGGRSGARAMALQNKIETWGGRAQTLGRPTAVLGGVGFEENARYLKDNWSQMSSEQRREQGGMMLLNLVDFGTPMILKGVQKGVQKSAQTLQQLRQPRQPAPAPAPWTWTWTWTWTRGRRAHGRCGWRSPDPARRWWWAACHDG